MKRFNLVQVALLAVLMVVAASCTPYRDAYGEYYEDEPVYRSYGTPAIGNGSVIILERDPFTGRYYQVSPYGYYSGSPYSYDNRYYNRGYDYYNRGYSRNQPVTRETEQNSQQTRERMNTAKERVLGNKKNN
ncbi:MAG: hypothetical protein ABR502_03800 [Chitinophagaceae bacterium]